MSDRELILRSLDQPGAFGELFDRHAPVIHRVMSRRVIDRCMVDDIVAETFLRAFERRHRFLADRDDALPWLFGFAMHISREQLRLARRFVSLDQDLEDKRDHLTVATDRVDAQQRLNAVLRAVQRLPPLSRDVVLLHTVGELSYEDVATALGIPVGTVRSRLSRARVRLRAVEDQVAPKTEVDMKEGRFDGPATPTGCII